MYGPSYSESRGNENNISEEQGKNFTNNGNQNLQYIIQ